MKIILGMCMVALAVLTSTTAAQDDAKAKEALAAFDKAYADGKKAKDQGARVKALEALVDVAADKGVIAAVAKVLKDESETDMVKNTAASVLGGSGAKEAVPALEAVCGAGKWGERNAGSVIPEIGRIKDGSAAKALARIARAHMKQMDLPSSGDVDQKEYEAQQRNNEVLTAALHALGSMATRDAVEALAGMYSSAPGTAEGNALTGSLNVKDQVFEALITATGQPFTEYAEWAKWWSKNKATFGK